MLPPVYDCYNLGVDSQTTTLMIANSGAKIDANGSGVRPRQIVVCWEGRNDIYNGATATQAYNNLITYCQDRRTAGFLVIVGTLLPASGFATPATFEADRQAVNTNLRANWNSFADALSDPGADATVGQSGEDANSTYYVDGTHMTNAGYAIVARIMANAILSLS
jgi:lysophospholipase L1-like esterase